MEHLFGVVFNNPLARGSDTSTRSMIGQIGSTIISPITTPAGLVPNVNNAAKQASDTFKNIDQEILPNISNISNQFKNTLGNVDGEIIPQMLMTMKMIQYATEKLIQFLRFLKAFMIILMAIVINYLYKHSEFILITAVIVIFSMDLLNQWNERYFETVEDERIKHGQIIKITSRLQRLNKMWVESGLEELSGDKNQYLDKFGEIIEIYKENESVSIKFEQNEMVRIPIRACVF